MCRSPSHTVRTSIHNFVISVIIKYHNFWAKLRYINIFRKNYLKHVVKNNYIIKPFFSVLITISLIFQTLNRVGWVSVVKINHMTKLCHFVSLIVLTEFWCLLGDLTQNGHRMTLSRQVKAKDSEGCCFALDETSDVTQNRTKLTAMKRLQDTCCIYTKTEKKSLHFFFLFVVDSVMSIQFLKRDHAGQKPLIRSQFLHLSWHNLVSLVLCHIPNIPDPINISFSTFTNKVGKFNFPCTPSVNVHVLRCQMLNWDFKWSQSLCEIRSFPDCLKRWNLIQGQFTH